MNRKIKFKGKAKDSDDWYYGSYVYLPDSNSHHIIPCGTFKPVNEEFILAQVEIDPDSLGQSTGVKDRHGVEIYTGDFLKIWEYDPNCPIDIDESDYRFDQVDEWGRIELIDAPWTLEDAPAVFEIIGNVYNNIWEFKPYGPCK